MLIRLCFRRGLFQRTVWNPSARRYLYGNVLIARTIITNQSKISLRSLY